MKKRLQLGLSLVLAAVVGSVLFVTQTASADEYGYSENVSQTDYFIQEIGETARQLAAENDLYASVMIAQAILESQSGTSGLATAPYYNLFGIKGQYAGQSVTMQTWEDDGSGNAYIIDDEFRAYPSYGESLQDYVAILSSSYYTGAWKRNTSSYLDATASLVGVYATDSSYNIKLNAIIAEYNLTQYDVDSLYVDYLYTSEAEAAVVDEDTDLVYNSYRLQYTSQATLDEDIAWAELTAY